MINQTIDPAVSRRKFDTEVAQFRHAAGAYRRKGIYLVEANFPTVMVVFAAANVRAVSPIVAAVVIDFKDYDLCPLSVTFVDPFTREKLKSKDLRLQMLRLQAPQLVPPEASQLIQLGLPQLINMIQAHGPEDVPFLCLPGVREYHDNPAHSGDPWLLIRGSGEGSLAFIVEKIWLYGANQVSEIAMQMQLSVTGFVSQPLAA